MIKMRQSTLVNSQIGTNDKHGSSIGKELLENSCDIYQEDYCHVAETFLMWFFTHPLLTLRTYCDGELSTWQNLGYSGRWTSWWACSRSSWWLELRSEDCPLWVEPPLGLYPTLHRLRRETGQQHAKCQVWDFMPYLYLEVKIQRIKKERAGILTSIYHPCMYSSKYVKVSLQVNLMI